MWHGSFLLFDLLWLHRLLHLSPLFSHRFRHSGYFWGRNCHHCACLVCMQGEFTGVLHPGMRKPTLHIWFHTGGSNSQPLARQARALPFELCLLPDILTAGLVRTVHHIHHFCWMFIYSQIEGLSAMVPASPPWTPLNRTIAEALISLHQWFTQG